MDFKSVREELQDVVSDAIDGRDMPNIERRLAVIATKFDYMAEHGFEGPTHDMEVLAQAIDVIRMNIRNGKSPQTMFKAIRDYAYAEQND